ncbi:MAG: hypothetical protein UZ05_CHB002000097 [Chlorobi bacterium OLB5]|nr:MAG: hypothetical protein UZ05_CHB002000097 [Chlorobi bacterium OLB5]
MKYITTQYQNYFNNLKNEISQYKNESDIWLLKGEIKNSPGTLTLHLCGNLNHNFGAVLGGNGYVRNRDKEFTDRNINKAELLKLINETEKTVIPVIESLTPEEMSEQFPEKFKDEEQTVYDAVIRLSFHFAYHVGQINYHRRLLTN